jgi:hypothetical protein
MELIDLKYMTSKCYLTYPTAANFAFLQWQLRGL